MVEATTKDRVSITTDDDETIICSGRLWRIYHDIGEGVLDCCCDTKGLDNIAAQIRRNATKIAMAVMRAESIK